MPRLVKYFKLLMGIKLCFHFVASLSVCTFVVHMIALQKHFMLLVCGVPVMKVYVHLVYSLQELRELHVCTVLDLACGLHMRHEMFGRFCQGHALLLQCGRSGYKGL